MTRFARLAANGVVFHFPGKREGNGIHPVRPSQPEIVRKKQNRRMRERLRDKKAA